MHSVHNLTALTPFGRYPLALHCQHQADGLEVHSSAEAAPSKVWHAKVLENNTASTAATYKQMRITGAYQSLTDPENASCTGLLPAADAAHIRTSRQAAATIDGNSPLCCTAFALLPQQAPHRIIADTDKFSKYAVPRAHTIPGVRTEAALLQGDLMGTSASDAPRALGSDHSVKGFLAFRSALAGGLTAESA